MAFDHYVCALEHKLTHNETIIKMKDQCKEEMFKPKDKWAMNKIEKTLIKCVQLDKRTMKKNSMRLWIAKHCAKVGNVLHVMTKIKETLTMHAYWAPFYIITLAIYKFNMTTTIEKRKARWEGREMVYIALIEQMWVHRRILGWILVEWHTSQTKLFIEYITQSSNDHEGPTSKLFKCPFCTSH
jgi:hypothetical protein